VHLFYHLKIDNISHFTLNYICQKRKKQFVQKHSKIKQMSMIIRIFFI